MNFFLKYPIISFFLVIFLIGIMGIATKVVLLPFLMASQTIEVVKKEFSPQELLRKYELFKNMSAQLDKYSADIQVYENRLAKAEKRASTDRVIIEQVNIMETELSGIKAAYNSLAAEYNAAMSKFNYSFCNVGQLPPGAMTPLPREFKPYLYN